VPARPLPPGQFLLRRMPRFGLGKFARRFPADPSRIDLQIAGDVETVMQVGADALGSLPRVERDADFHCVTTWSVQGVRWTGVRFADFYERIVRPRTRPAADVRLVVFHGEDGYRSSLPLEDLLADDVLLADGLDGEPLGVEHGAPLRLVAPAHYGYKNVKHLRAIEFWRDARHYRFPFPYPAFMDHPRARVAFEERGRVVPGWLLRVYRLIVPLTILNFRLAMRRHRAPPG
jgi:DMSO/TMAO reductase YedYZ molybdopterin-dependent catalytic subunit